jgi:hypothetical protein
MNKLQTLLAERAHNMALLDEADRKLAPVKAEERRLQTAIRDTFPLRFWTDYSGQSRACVARYTREGQNARRHFYSRLDVLLEQYGRLKVQRRELHRLEGYYRDAVDAVQKHGAGVA